MVGIFGGYPTVKELEKEGRLDTILKNEAMDHDCLPCKLTGAAAFGGLGAYVFVSGHNQLRKQEKKILASKSPFGMQSRKAGITGLAFTLVGVAFWRLAN